MHGENNKMKMIQHLGRSKEPIHITNMSSSVDCSKDASLHRSLRYLLECIIPYCCACDSHSKASLQSRFLVMPRQQISCPSKLLSGKSTVIGTFFGYCRSRVSFCLHDESQTTTNPLLLLEFSVPTEYLAKEMQHSLLRIALECNQPYTDQLTPIPLFSMPVWSMYCNGRNVGFAITRKVNEADLAVFRVMKSVSAGAGVLPGKVKKSEGELMYLRARFERVVGSVNSESFYMIDPLGSTEQHLSVFLVRT